MREKRKCLVCGKETYNKKFCSMACRSASAPSNARICEFCGKKFKAARSDQKYCCRECYNNYKKKVGNVMVRCATCGKLFQVVLAKKGEAKYCSNKCKFARYQKPPLRKLTHEEVIENLQKLNRIEKPTFKRSCANCRYCQMVLEPYGDRGCWNCNNAGSEYYKSLLNIDEDGLANRNVSWSGCEHWKIARERGDVKRRTAPDDYELYVAELAKVEMAEKQKESMHVMSMAR